MIVVPENHITTQEAADRLGVSANYVHLLVSRKYLPEPIRLRASFHSADAIEEYARAHPRLGKRREEQSA